ncbi:MAG: DUF1194 domain-containing protein [Gemmobacter sp.]
MRWIALLFALGLTPALTPAAAQAPCRLALALAFDVSRSVDRNDYRIQIDGILAALADEGIRAALLDPSGAVALALYEWSGPEHQDIGVPWTVIRSTGDIDAVMARIAAHRRDPRAQATGLGAALAAGRALLRQAPGCAALTLDVSGDGRSNVGPDPGSVHARGDWAGITVNGLAIGGHESDIARYYEREVIRGPAAFVEFARTHRDFPEAFRRKLYRELVEQVHGAAPGLAPVGPVIR